MLVATHLPYLTLIGPAGLYLIRVRATREMLFDAGWMSLLWSGSIGKTQARARLIALSGPRLTLLILLILGLVKPCLILPSPKGEGSGVSRRDTHRGMG